MCPGESSKTHHVGFRCPIDVYENVLAKQTDKTKFIVSCLTGVQQGVQHQPSSVEHPNHDDTPAALAFMKLFNTLADDDSKRAFELYNTLNEEEQVILREFLEKHQ